jgi:hypothetical protein
VESIPPGQPSITLYKDHSMNSSSTVEIFQIPITTIPPPSQTQITSPFTERPSTMKPLSGIHTSSENQSTFLSSTDDSIPTCSDVEHKESILTTKRPSTSTLPTINPIEKNNAMNPFSHIETSSSGVMEVSQVLTSLSPTPTSFVNTSAMSVGRLLEPEKERNVTEGQSIKSGWTTEEMKRIKTRLNQNEIFINKRYLYFFGLTSTTSTTT